MAKKPIELTKWVGVRLTLTDFAGVQEYAEKLGIPMSMLIRNLIKKELEGK